MKKGVKDMETLATSLQCMINSPNIVFSSKGTHLVRHAKYQMVLIQYGELPNQESEHRQSP